MTDNTCDICKKKLPVNKTVVCGDCAMNIVVADTNPQQQRQ